ncbi:helix-turn-helix domain-containing protein [uncultured Alistipes sp.]|jgi:hypothetical protein|uniref:winged helix-turn-helix transcriptional regulator n=1 Tax=uncultured Alistipes sp. TaxID=538949 RepID=UPI0025D4E164|nr:helix-turn-helix domain-containing protein [uncultured Alistipes sp.]
MKTKKSETICPVRDIMSRFGDKWSLLVLLELEQGGVMRFSELARAIPDVSQKMLTVTLRTLKSYRLVSREIYPEVPPRVEYSLTDLGRSLLPHVNALVDWAMAHRSQCIGETARN